MQRRMIASVGVATVIAAFSITSIAQQPAGQRQGGTGRQSGGAVPDNRPFNARELAGVWSRNGNEAYRAGRDIQAGRVWVNNYHAYPAGAAFGGY